MAERIGKRDAGKKPWSELRSREDDRIDLRLYVTNRTPRCLAAYDNLVRICAEYANRPCRITVIDLLKDPAAARKEQITAIPTLVRTTCGGGRRKIVGTLADARKVVECLGLGEEEQWHKPAPA
jgi:circadian clock protein KaiB